MKRLNRRTLLRGGGSLALSLPLLEAMLPKASAQAADTPRRILFEFKANGDQTARRFTATGETTFAFDEFLAPLEPYRSDLLILNKLARRYNLLGDKRSDGHQQGGASLAPWESGEGSYPIGGKEGVTIGYVLGPSADHEIGERVIQANPGVKYRHLVYRVGQKNNDIWNVSSHAGPLGMQNPVLPETDPYAAYARIFTFGSDDAAAKAEIEKRLLKKQSALDLVLDEAASLQTKLGSADRARIQQHMDALRDIERTLSNGNGAVGCQPLTLGEKLDPYKDDNHEAIGKLFQKISTLAFACDLTRSINFNWSGNTSNRVYRNLGLDLGHHDISHDSSDAAFTNIRAIHKHLWTMSTALYDDLKAVQEGGGTLWDNTLIVHWNELGQGDTHSENDAMVILAGGGANYFKRGRYLDFNNKLTFADMLVSCFHYMGYEDVMKFGDDRLNDGAPLPGLTA
ncbi:MAG TPA: DUF1552 domain-containing protein [Polyangiaceae bacterium]|nr:DUF1552 domain-containing protein [Polyangiaceae bacterium]